MDGNTSTDPNTSTAATTTATTATTAPTTAAITSTPQVKRRMRTPRHDAAIAITTTGLPSPGPRSAASSPRTASTTSTPRSAIARQILQPNISGPISGLKRAETVIAQLSPAMLSCLRNEVALELEPAMEHRADTADKFRHLHLDNNNNNNNNDSKTQPNTSQNSAPSSHSQNHVNQSIAPQYALKRTRIITTTITVEDAIFPTLIPRILSYTIPTTNSSSSQSSTINSIYYTLRQTLCVSKCFFYASIPLLYETIVISGPNGSRRLEKLLQTLEKCVKGHAMGNYRDWIRYIQVIGIVCFPIKFFDPIPNQEQSKTTQENDQIHLQQGENNILESKERIQGVDWDDVKLLLDYTAKNICFLYLHSHDSQGWLKRMEREEPALYQKSKDSTLNATGSLFLPPGLAFPSLQHVSFPAGNTNIPDEVIYDILRRASNSSLLSLRLPGCIKSMSGTGYYLITERSGSSLEDLILTPPKSYKPIPTYGATSSSTPYSSSSLPEWDTSLLIDGLNLLSISCTNLRALDISGHNLPNLPPAFIDTLLSNSPLLEEIDLPCNLTDAHIYPLLTAGPDTLHLWRINLSCQCPQSLTLESTIQNWCTHNSLSSTSSIKGEDDITTKVDCNVFTDGVIKGLIHVLKGRRGALLECPCFVVGVGSAKKVATMKCILDTTSLDARVDFGDTDALFCMRVGVKVVVPFGRYFI